MMWNPVCLVRTTKRLERALHRHESRGLHYTLDYPETAAEAVDTVLVP
jgi:L-aspartate oxidase